MITVIPAIIPSSYEELAAKAKQVKGAVKRMQIDVLDGLYTSTPASWPYNDADAKIWKELVAQTQSLPFWQDLDYEIDMMVRNPEEKVGDWIVAGAAAVIIHIESTEHMGDVIALCQERGVDVALALKPSTTIDLLEPWIEQVAFVQCMGSDTIGAQGLELDPRVLGKIEDIRNRFPNATIGVDIGVTQETAVELAHAGATRLVSGSAVFTSDNIKDAIRHLESA